MSRCDHYQELIESLLADDISAGDRSDLERHCSQCPECDELLALHGNLLLAAEEIPMPERHRLREMREEVLLETRADSRDSGSGFLADLRRLWTAHPLASGLAASLLLVGCIALGRMTLDGGKLEEDPLLGRIRTEGIRQANLNDYLDTPYSFANVSVRPQGQGRLGLSFDVSRHVEIQVPQDSPLAREVLVHAILDPSSMGSRLQAMEVTPGIRDDHLKDALIVTMLDDPDATVRLSALDVIARYPYDPEIEMALLRTLAEDQDVQMRLTAMEELVRHEVGAETIRDAVGETDPNGTMAIVRPAMSTY